MAGPNSDPARTPSKSSLHFCVGAAVLAICLAALIMSTWQKWGDMVLDFGVQLYIPWKLSSGAVLYRDVAYLTGGPVSQYFHSLLFRMCGVSVLTLAIANCTVLAILTAMIYRMFYRISDAWTATVAGLALLLVFAFGHFVANGIFNYVAPYSYELVHGTVVAIGVVWLLSRWVLERKPAVGFFIGLGTGFVLLTKLEVIVAVAVVEVAAIVAAHRARPNAGGTGKSLLAAALGIPVIPAGFLLYFLQHERFQESVRSVFWAIAPAAAIRHAFNDNFYLWCMGLNVPTLYLKRILYWTAGLAFSTAFYAGVFYLKVSRNARFGLLALVGIATGYLAVHFSWGGCGYCLPATCIASIILSLLDAKRNGAATWQPLPLLWSIFSLAMLAKLGLFPRIWHYGFVLGMPAFLGAVYLLLWQLPPILERRGVHIGCFKAIVSLALLMGFRELWLDSNYAYNSHSLAIGEGADRLILMTPRLRPANLSLANVTRWIETNTPPSSTLAVLPEGVMVNYLARRDNPTGFLRWNPTESSMFGQENMTEAFMKHPPDFIAIIDSGGEGVESKPFGSSAEYGLSVKQWIDANYHTNFETGPAKTIVFKRNAKHP